MKESGLIKKWKSDYYPQPARSSTGQTGLHRASIEDCQGAFIVLAMGIVFSFMIMLLEVIIHRIGGHFYNTTYSLITLCTLCSLRQ